MASLTNVWNSSTWTTSRELGEERESPSSRDPSVRTQRLVCAGAVREASDPRNAYLSGSELYYCIPASYGSELLSSPANDVAALSLPLSNVGLKSGDDKQAHGADSRLSHGHTSEYTYRQVQGKGQEL